MAKAELRARLRASKSDFQKPKWSGRRTLVFAVGVSLACWLAAYSCAHAEPVFLTRAQQVDIIRINQRENDRNPHLDRRGHGQCVLIAELKQMRMIRYGVPPEALRLRVVRAPRGSAEPTHELLDIDAVVGGRPWRVAFDMNFPWPLTAREEYEVGYSPVR